MGYKKIGVLFSGGLDSTYLIWKNLKEKNEIFPFYVEILNNKNKTILEKNRIFLLYEQFSKEFKNKIHEPKNILSITVNHNTNHLMLKQIPIWILSILFSLNENFDEFQIGYVMNDDGISYINDIKKIYNAYKPILDVHTPLIFPLTKMKKDEIVNNLPKKYLNLTVSCEIPKIIGDKNAKILNYKPCGYCEPCKRIINHRYYEKFKNDIHDFYKKIEIENSKNTILSYEKNGDVKFKKNKYYLTYELFNTCDKSSDTNNKTSNN